MIVFTYLCGYVCVCIWIMDRTYGSLFLLSPLVCFLKILATTCRIDKRKSQAFPFESESRLCCPFHDHEWKVFLGSRWNDFFGRGRNELNDRKLTCLIKFFVIYTLAVDQKIVLLQLLKFKRVDISWPIRFVFLLICFRA